MMAGHERGRSPSGGQHAPQHIRLSTSASPHPQPHMNSASSFAGADTYIAHDSFNPLQPGATPGLYNDPSFTQDYSQQAKWSLGPTYPDYQQQEQLQQPPIVPSQLSDISNHTFLQSAGIQSQGYGAHSGQSSDHVSPSALTQNSSPNNTESSAFPSFDFSQTGFDQSGALDPSILADLDVNAADLLSTQENGVSALNPMAATMQSHSPTPPHLLPEMACQQSGSPSPHASPNFQQMSFQGFNRPRNTSESLDPSSAMYPQGQTDWSHMHQYRGHRRTPSDNYSDISSHSNHASPYLGTLGDNFDGNAHSSPMLNPSDPSFNGDLGLHGFTISENQQASYISPGHSPHPSPRLAAQQALPPFTADNNYGLTTSMNGYMQSNLEMFPSISQEAFPALNHSSPGEVGAADQMSPPEINIDYAPPTKNPMDNMRPGNAEDTLSPPLRTQSRNRTRAKSDSYAGSRPSSPGLPGRGRSPSLQPQQSNDMLAPVDNQPSSRSPSPVRGRNGSLGARARSSSHASDQRDYILDLAIPERTPSNDNKGRVQKHPATFQCTLCPKRFTRAYNLRSHLRTHTDERPFVCTVCGKAFARQHDRKRHEGLHSGEKKFVCRGNLQSGQHWGCSRRFARADALGRHFRSEAGRVCIKPLLDEEAAERQKAWMEEQQQAQVPAGLVAPQPIMQQPQVDMLGSFLPAALLQQYPALAGLNWNEIPQGNPPEEDMEYSGRSSFEASSGGEYMDDMSENEMAEMAYADPSMNGMNGMNSMNAMSNMAMNQQMNMNQAHSGAQQQYGGYGGGNQMGDYLSDIEGR